MENLKSLEQVKSELIALLVTAKNDSTDIKLSTNLDLAIEFINSKFCSSEAMIKKFLTELGIKFNQKSIRPSWLTTDIKEQIENIALILADGHEFVNYKIIVDVSGDDLKVTITDKIVLTKSEKKERTTNKVAPFLVNGVPCFTKDIEKMLGVTHKDSISIYQFMKNDVGVKVLTSFNFEAMKNETFIVNWRGKQVILSKNIQ